MCTVIELGQVPKKTKKDITVYKYCHYIDETSVKSSLIHHIYKKGVIYNSKFSYENEEGCSDIEELHYKTKLEASKHIIYVVTGFHAYASLERASRSSWDHSLQLFEFIIPEGTLYYKNGSGCIVAEKIYLKEAKCVQ